MILTIAKRDVVTAGPDDSLRDVAGLMDHYNVGCVVLTQGDKPVGILTDRDLALLLAKTSGPQDFGLRTAGDSMSRPPQTISEEAGFERALEIMWQQGFRRLPVVDRRGRLRGMVTLDDILGALSHNLASVTGLIRHQQKPGKKPAAVRRVRARAPA